MTKAQRERLRRMRKASRLAALADAIGIDPRLLRKPVHLTSSERKFIGRTWNAADAARSDMSPEKKAALDHFRAAVPRI